MAALHSKRGASAPSNVVRLPTAARCIVRQPSNRAGVAVRKAYREAHPWPGRYIHPGVRKMLPLAEAIMAARGNPILERAVNQAANQLCRTVGDQVTLDAALNVMLGEG